MTVDDSFGMGNGTMAAGRIRAALFGSLETVPQHDQDRCREAYLKSTSFSLTFRSIHLFLLFFLCGPARFFYEVDATNRISTLIHSSSRS